MQVSPSVPSICRTLPGILPRAFHSQWALSLAAISLIVLTGPGAAAAENPDLTRKSLEDLMNIEVTSVSKKEQKTSQAAAAVFVISRDDIQHLGALNIPDLLRMVPGVDVAQIDASNWAISVRGFNGQFSNKLLVLIDGRMVYNPIFAGVFWNSQNVPLDSIERIEVIRGPGAAMWGSNAVDGVFNIITTSAANTQGTSISAGAGNANTGPETIRYGGTIRTIGAYRVYAEGFQVNALPTFAGQFGQDDWRLVHGGFRTDRALSSRDSITTEGEVYRGNAGEMAFVPLSLLPPENASVPLRDSYSGWNLLTQWNRIVSPDSNLSLKVDFDRSSRGDSSYSIGLNTFDIDFQHHIVWGPRQDIVWGLGYRSNSDDVSPTLRISALPQRRMTQLFSSFAQDEFVIIPNRLQLSVGARLEHNDYTGLNLQPSVRLVWSPDSKNSVWGAVSGAERTPARTDRDLRVNYEVLPGSPQTGNLPVLVSLFGNPHQKNEKLTAFEAGYRTTLTSRISFDSATFYNRYLDQISVEPGAIRIETDPAPVHLLIPSVIGNGLYGETHGIEVFANLKIANTWTLNPGYGFLSTHLHRSSGSQDFTSSAAIEGGTPDHQAQLRSSVVLPRNIEWNVSVFFVNRLPAVSIPSYTRLDSGLVWRVGESVSISLTGQNLSKNLHPEYSGPSASVQPGMMRRDACAKITWSF